MSLSSFLLIPYATRNRIAVESSGVAELLQIPSMSLYKGWAQQRSHCLSCVLRRQMVFFYQWTVGASTPWRKRGALSVRVIQPQRDQECKKQ